MTYLPKEALDICSVIEEELSVLRSVLENNLDNQIDYYPMITFFSDHQTRQCVITPPATKTFVDGLISFSEILYLYPALESNSALISICSELQDDNGIKTSNCMNVFIISEDAAFIINMPYNIHDNSIIWQYDNFTCKNIADEDFEGISNEMINMFFMFTHLENPIYSVEEILSYLSANGTIIHLFDNMKTTYFDMSS